MNWTGGALPRSRNGNAKATLTSVQKKHFAKVRGKLLGPAPSSPDFDTSIFKDAENRSLQQHDKPLQPTPRDRQSQTRLDSYDDIAPIVRNLGSLRPRQNHVQRGKKVVSRGPQTNVRDRSAHSSRSHRGYPNKVIGIDKVDHNRPPLVRKQAASSTVASFEAKRQQLLRKIDWVGLANTRPVKIAFPSARDRGRIGKRRRLNIAEQEVSLYQAQQPRRLAYLSLEERGAPRRYGQPSSSLGDISVRIGEQEHEENLRPERPITDMTQDRYGGTPDEMLFDHENASTSYVHSQAPRPIACRQAAPTESSSVSARRSLVPDRATPASLSDSWAGFSPWTESGDIHIRVKQEAKADSQPGDFRTTLRAAAPAERSRQPVEQPWAGAPGLPLIFSDSTREPIEISSDCDSDSSIDSIYPPSVQELPHLALSADEQGQPKSSKATGTSDFEGAIVNLVTLEKQEHILPAVETTSQPSVNATIVPPEEASIQGMSPRSKGKAVGVLMLLHTADPSKLENAYIPINSSGEGPAISANAGFAASPMPGPVFAVPPPPRPSTQTLADEELIWRQFVFGSDDVDHTQILEDEADIKPRTKPVLTDISSPTVSTINVNHSSLLAEVSSSNPAATTAHRSSSPDQLSILAQPSITQKPYPMGTASSAYPRSSSLSSNSLRNQSQSHSPSKSSLQVQASASTSPLRTQNKLPLLSSDELAATPARPTFVFRKPTRYVGSEGESQERIFLGSGSKRKARKGKGRASDIDIWEDLRDREHTGMREEDEIEDEDFA